VLACGPLERELGLFRALRLRAPEALLGGVSPGLSAFPTRLGQDPEGMLAVAQWHPGLGANPRLGPSSAEVVGEARARGVELDYVGAQAYAAALIAARCLELAPDEYLYPASMLKTPLAAAALELVHRGELHLDQLFEVTEWNMTANDAESPFVTGFRGPLTLIIERALTHSDNVATNMLFDVAGRERATAIAQERLHLRRTAFHRKLSGSLPLIEDREWDGVHRNSHPAADAARLFASIARNEVPRAAELYDALVKQTWNEKLPRGLEPADVFVHKTGDTNEVTHDGGILQTQQGGVYVLAVYTGMPSTPHNNAKFGPFMARLRTFLR